MAHTRTTMDSSDLTAQFPDLSSLGSIQAELDRLHEATGGSGGLSDHVNPVVSTQSAIQQQLAMPTVSMMSSHNQQFTSGNNTITMDSLNSAQGVMLGTFQNDQLVLTSQASQQPNTNQFQAVKRSLVGSPGSQVVTKVIITKNPVSNQPQAVPVSQAQGQQQQQIMFSGPFTQHSGSLTPTKSITISQSSLLSPTKLVSALPNSPKQFITTATGGKIALSPMKTPTKITMIPVSSKSPQRIQTSSGQYITMVPRSLTFGGNTSTISTTTSKPATITMSPTKVIYKQQPSQGALAKPVIAQQLNMAPKTTTGQIVSMGGTNLQPLPVSGSRFQYVRLVAAQPNVSTGGTMLRPATIAPATMAGKALLGNAQQPQTVPQQTQMKIAMPVQQQSVISKNVTQMPLQPQRILLPATTMASIRPQGMVQTTLAQIRPAGSTGALSSLPPGTTIISSGQSIQGMQGFALVPAQYVTQIQQQQPGTSQSVVAATSVVGSSQGNQDSWSTSTSNSVSSAARQNSINGSSIEVPSGNRPRKPCNCTKSQCLKLYCDCFANGEFCHNCNCTNCANNLEHEEERQRAIKSCLDRNPLAFHPKIGKKVGKAGRGSEGERRHNKGCNCKRSGCLKNYCECYEAKILCTNLCKCVGCKNFEESPDRKTLMHLADAAEVRVQQQTAAKTKLSSQIQDLPTRPQHSSAGENRLPYTFVTREVAEATCACLMAQAEEAERTRQMDICQERMLLEEFGRCLMQVIESANSTKAPSPIP